MINGRRSQLSDDTAGIPPGNFKKKDFQWHLVSDLSLHYGLDMFYSAYHEHWVVDILKLRT